MKIIGYTFAAMVALDVVTFGNLFFWRVVGVVGKAYWGM
jgi:hypothetical protein